MTTKYRYGDRYRLICKIKGIIISKQVYAAEILEPRALGLSALKALRAIIDLEKEKLLVKKLIEELEFVSELKTRSILLNRGGVIEPWAKTTLQGKSIWKFKR